MSSLCKFGRLATLSAVAALVPLAAHAESQFVTSGSATARLDFRITIPKFLFLQVGTGPAAPAVGNNTTVDRLDFDVPATDIGNGIAVAGTGGDLGTGTVTARLISNAGTISLAAAGTVLTNATAETIPFSQIGVAATAVTAPLTPPVIGAAAANVAPTSGRVTNRHSTWRFNYLNTNVVPDGVYNGTVTYTTSSI